MSEPVIITKSVTFPDQAACDLMINASAYRRGYPSEVDGQPNPESKVDFVWRAMVKDEADANERVIIESKQDQIRAEIQAVRAAVTVE